MLVSFLFWNLMKRDLQKHIARMASIYQIDVLMLAECEIAADEIKGTLQQATGQSYQFSEPLPGAVEKVSLFTRSAITIQTQFNDEVGRLTIKRVSIDGILEVLLAIVHFPSRVNYDLNDQTLQATVLASDIVRAERDSGVTRTILVGDLNMNPFDIGVSGASALHGVMTKDLARRGTRTVQGRSYRFFYNPMWGLFGDRTAGPPGTFHLPASKPHNYFWNMYDQVLLRPELMDGLYDLQILDFDGTERLVTPAGLPRRLDVSDHLPLFFRLEL